MGGMFSVLKVRKDQKPGDYKATRAGTRIDFFLQFST
jgi:hypothetical protein